MKTVALRFADNFAPDEGTIDAHERIIEEKGYVWYGKLGASLSIKVINDLLSEENPKILLIHSGKQDRYWAYIKLIQRDLPNLDYIPDYYKNNANMFKTWFKIIRFERASNDVLSLCKVLSSQRSLSEVSKSSMSPYFIIETEE